LIDWFSILKSLGISKLYTKAARSSSFHCFESTDEKVDINSGGKTIEKFMKLSMLHKVQGIKFMKLFEMLIDKVL
jgi:hypothetical protein